MVTRGVPVSTDDYLKMEEGQGGKTESAKKTTILVSLFVFDGTSKN